MAATQKHDFLQLSGLAALTNLTSRASLEMGVLPLFEAKRTEMFPEESTGQGGGTETETERVIGTPCCRMCLVGEAAQTICETGQCPRAACKRHVCGRRFPGLPTCTACSAAA